LHAARKGEEKAGHYVRERERERERESFHVLYLHIFVDKLEYNKFPLFVNFDIRDLDVSTH
jgi:hypothetical protein